MKKRLQMALIISVLALTLVACGGSSEVDTGQGSDSGESSDSGQEGQQSGAVTYSQGEAVEVSGLKLTIEKVEKYETSNEFMEPTEGNEFLAVMVQIENISGEGKDYNEVYDFKLKNEDGTEYEMAITDAEPDLGSGTLQSTKKAKGYVVFEVPEGTSTSQMEFYYEPLSFDTIQVIWELE